jgi:outer membrane protein
MKKKIVASFFVVATLVLVFSQVGFAQDMEGKFGVGVRVAYVNYTGESSHLIDGADFDDAAMYGANLTYFVHRNFSFELSIDYAESDLDYLDITMGELEQVPILLTARTHLSTNPNVNPYLGIGLGYYLNDFDLSDSSQFVKVDPDDGFGFHLSAGVEYFVNEHFALNLELKYIFNEVDFIFKTPGDRWKEAVDLDTFYTGVGIKYYF